MTTKTKPKPELEYRLESARGFLEAHGYYVSRSVAEKMEPLEPPPATPDVMDFGTIPFDRVPRLFRRLFRRGEIRV